MGYPLETGVKGELWDVYCEDLGENWPRYNCTSLYSGWETNARPLANASENLAGRVENRPGQVEYCIGYIRDCPVRVSAKRI